MLVKIFVDKCPNILSTYTVFKCPFSSVLNTFLIVKALVRRLCQQEETETVKFRKASLTGLSEMFN